MFFTDHDSDGPIFGFQGDFRFLSNFWPALVERNGLPFASVEHGYQAAKSAEFVSQSLFATWGNLTAGKAKRLGKQLPVRPDWDDLKVGVMEDLVFQKFSKHEDLKALLLTTGDRKIFELNTWGDEFWGVTQDSHGRLKGLNTLGTILMNVRQELRT